jgi:penicillin-insensitive murein endopeptidase
LNDVPPPQAATAEPAAETAATTPAPDAAKPKLIAAKTLFGAAKNAAPLAARSIGTYSRGCLAGAKPLAVDGPAWQAMRLSRNRTWGHPDLIAMLERFAGEVKQDGWPGLLVGDLSQPRGGPMLTGHASHQLGLDADIWFTPMPDHRLTKKERETLAATSMLANDSLSVDPKIWTDSRVKIIKRVASYPKVERVLVHPAIKKALCEAGGTDRAWLNKVRPYWGHFYHFHVRIGCPAGSAGCKPQAPVPGDDGCGKELDDWFKLLSRKPKPRPPTEPKIVVKPSKPKPPITLDDLPAECRTVLATGSDIKLPPPAAVASTHAKAKSQAKAAAAKGPAVAKPAAAKAAPKPAEKKAAPTKAAAAKTVEKTNKE